MPSSGYTAITFVANEQPTTAKWNLIGSNDAAFNLGTGLEDSTILTRHLALGAVLPEKLDFSAMGIIRSTTGTGNFNTTTTIDSVSVVIPTGCTQVLIIGTCRLQSQDPTNKDMTCWIDYNATTAISMSFFHTTIGSTFTSASVALVDRIPVTAGTRTFQLRANNGAGTMNIGNRCVFIIPIKA